MKFVIGTKTVRVRKYKKGEPNFTWKDDSKQISLVDTKGVTHVTYAYHDPDRWKSRLAFNFEGQWYAVPDHTIIANFHSLAFPIVWTQVYEKPRKEYKRVPINVALAPMYGRTDPIRVGRGENETNDCTVISLSNVMGIPYEEAHRILEDSGRKLRKGTHMDKVLETSSILRDRFKQVYQAIVGVRRITVATYAKEHPVGKFIVLTRGHAQSIINGKILDNTRFKPMRRIVKVYQLVEDEK